MSAVTKIFSVSELTVAIKQQLESAYPFVSVKGEITNFKQQSSGHLYFTLKDERAQISAALFKGNARSLKRLPKAGDQVVAQGELSVYPPRGNYQLIVRSLQFEGVGELLVRFHELKQKLEARGWFDSTRKKPLPAHPKTIGVITSPTGAVIQDILHVLSRRSSGFHLILNPVKVQGEGAAQEIARAVNEMNEHNLCDLLIVGRGGGSLEDLWAFNEEVVAEAIFHSKIPVISAVGHETDVTLADCVADVRAPTPSAAAEIAVAEKAQQLKNLKLIGERIEESLRQLIKERKVRLEHFLSHPLLASPEYLLTPYTQRLDELSNDLTTVMRTSLMQMKMRLFAAKREVSALNPKEKFRVWRQKLGVIEDQLTRRAWEDIAQRKERLQYLKSHLKAIDPRNLLTKGYCVLFPENKHSAILSAKAVKKGQKISVLMQDGRIQSTVDEVTIHE